MYEACDIKSILQPTKYFRHLMLLYNITPGLLQIPWHSEPNSEIPVVVLRIYQLSADISDLFLGDITCDFTYFTHFKSSVCP